MKEKYAIGVDVGGSHLTSAVVDLEEGKVCSDYIVTPMESKGPLEHVIACFKKNLEATLEAFEEPIHQIGFAFPGPFDYEKGISYMKQKFDNLYGINLPDVLRKVLEVPEIEKFDFKFINDASAFGVGECFCGAGKGFKRVFGVTLGTGVGSAFLVDGKIDETSENVPEGGEVWNLPFHDTIVDASFSTRWFVKRYGELTGKTIKGAKDVADQFGKEAAADQCFAEFGASLAEFATPWLKKFGADLFVMGGNISREYPKFQAQLLAGMPEGVTVKTSELRDQAAMIGAASLFTE